MRDHPTNPGYYEIHDWEDHQSETTTAWIRVYTKLLVSPKYLRLNAGERGLLLSIWLYRGLTGNRPEVDARRTVLGLGLAYNRHIPGQLKRLEDAGFLHRRALQRRGDKRRGEKTPPTPKPVAGGERVRSGFAGFWEAYPRKVGKRAAATAWKRLKLESRSDEMISAVKSQQMSEAWTKDDGQFIPHPTTWLNQGRWDDQIGGNGVDDTNPWKSREAREWLRRNP